MRGRKFNWTVEQDQFLKDNWGKMSAHQIKNKFGCSWQLVVEKADKLGLARPVSNGWSEDEVETLKKLAEKYHYTKIAKRLGKSERAIYQKAKQLGLVLRQDYRQWTVAEEEYLSDNWGRLSLVTMAGKMKRSLTSLKVKGKRMKLGAMDENDLDVLKISEIEEILSVSRKVIMETWRNGGLKVTKKGVTPDYSYYSVKVKNLWQFLEDNQDLWHTMFLEKNILGEEPEWLWEKREKDCAHPPVEYRFWTSDELKKARDLLAIGFNYQDIAQKINRSPGSVAWKIREIGLSYSNKFYWQEAEESILKEQYIDKTADELTEMIDRTPRAIQVKARSLGVQKKLIRGRKQ